MIDWAELFKQAVGLFAIVDPIGAAAIYISITANLDEAGKKRTAIVTSATVAIVLLVSIAVGENLLRLFGVSIASFQVGGGILIFLLAFAMLNAKPTGFRRTAEEVQEAEEMDSVAVVPLAIPILAGPGAISTVIINSHSASVAADYVALSAISIGVALIVLATFWLAIPIVNCLGRTGVNIVTRLMGLLLVAIGVEIIAAGIRALFPGLA